jgi:hypothetical protein
MSKENAYIMTYTGKMFNPFYPDEDLICVEDIAHALSMQCRYNGHINKFYSVAEHSIDVALVLRMSGLSPRTQLLGLLHDATETYLSDIPAPIKQCFPEYQNLEDTLSVAIYKKLHPAYRDITVNDLYYVNLIDKELGDLESKKLMRVADWNNRESSFDTPFYCWGSGEVEQKFLTLYNILLEELANEQTANRTRNK